MRIKTYFAGTVEAAISLASRELGGDALLLAARAAGPDTRHLGAYEVVFGVPSSAARPNSLREFLLDQDCHANLIEHTLKSLEGRDASDGEVWAAIRETVSFAPWDPAKPYRLALIGPAGAGKTSTTLKLALHSAQPPQIYDADAGKLGSQLGRAAAIAGLGYAATEPAGFAGRAAKGGPLLLDMESSPDHAWMDALAQAPDVTVSLVLPATWRTADLSAAIRRYQAFRPSLLILTRLDETSRAGGALSAAALSGLPVFAFCSAPGLVEGIEPSGESRILELLFRPRPPQERHAAAGGAR
jgi:flagellar biosynthesis GTPase FlhF